MAAGWQSPWSHMSGGNNPGGNRTGPNGQGAAPDPGMGSDVTAPPARAAQRYGGAPLGSRGGNYDATIPQGVWGGGTAPGAPGSGRNTAMTGKEGLLSGAGYYEDFYKQHGQDLINSPSASEDLYAKGVNALNPYYDYAQQQAIKAINDQSAARGGFNSSHAMTNIGNQVSNIRGQQAQAMADLAKQSDAAKYSRYDRTADYADRGQKAAENRITGAGNAYTNLADKQAGLVRGFYGDATKGMTDTNMAAIELQLKEAGLNQEQIKQVLDMGFSAGGLMAKGSGGK